MSNRHIMFDIETLGTAPGAPILSIGAVRFHPLDIPPLFKPAYSVARKSFKKDGAPEPDSFYRTISLTSNIREGLMEITQGSFDFWMQQPAEVQMELLEHRVPIKEALSDFWKWFDAEDYDGVWAHGTTFDVPLLQEAYLTVNNQDRVPWRYRAVRDTRTVFSIAYPNERIPVSQEDKHNALMDSYYQAKMVQKCYERINQWKLATQAEGQREVLREAVAERHYEEHTAWAYSECSDALCKKARALVPPREGGEL